MKDPRTKDLPLLYLLGPQLDWLYYSRQDPDELPNDLTRLRMRLIPLQLTLLLTGLVTGNRWLLAASLIILCFQGLTDWIDGYIAWRFDCATPEGAQLDPRADKLVVLPNLLVYSMWSIAFSDPKYGLPLLVVVIMAIWLDVESDRWYRRNMGGKSNNFGKYKFTLHILVAGVGIIAMLSRPSADASADLALMSAFVMLAANVLARTSLNLKRAGLGSTLQAKDHESPPSLLEGLAHAHPSSIADGGSGAPFGTPRARPDCFMNLITL